MTHPPPEPPFPAAAPGPEPSLLAQGLHFAYPGRPVLRGFSHAFGPGLTWVQGGNGCGKSTLLRVLAGALEPASGRRVALGIDAAADPTGYRRQLFWCAPEPIAYDHLRADEYLGLLAGLYPGYDLDLAQALVADFGLTPFATRLIGQLSTGSGRKLAVLAALASPAPVLLLDEPLAGVDARSGRTVRALLAEQAADGRVLVVTSHEDLDLGEDTPVQVLAMPAAG